MRIDHGRLHVLMSKQFSDCPNIVPVLKKVGREGLVKVFCGAKRRYSTGPPVCESCGGANGRRGNVDLMLWSIER